MGYLQPVSPAHSPQPLWRRLPGRDRSYSTPLPVATSHEPQATNSSFCKKTRSPRLTARSFFYHNQLICSAKQQRAPKTVLSGNGFVLPVNGRGQVFWLLYIVFYLIPSMLA